jgi:hypothetical protein
LVGLTSKTISLVLRFFSFSAADFHLSEIFFSSSPKFAVAFFSIGAVGCLKTFSQLVSTKSLVVSRFSQFEIHEIYEMSNGGLSCGWVMTTKGEFFSVSTFTFSMSRVSFQLMLRTFFFFEFTVFHSSSSLESVNFSSSAIFSS